MGDHMGYYNNRSIASCSLSITLVLAVIVIFSFSRQFKWFNPSNIDYSTISDKRNAPNYRCC